MGGSWDKLNTDSDPGKARWLAKGNLEETPHISDLNCHKGATFWVHLCVYPYVLFSFPPNKHFISLLSVFVGIHFCRAEGPGPCHWPLVWWLGFGASHCTTQTQSLSGNWKLCFRLLQLRPPEIVLSGGLYINTHKKSPGSVCTNSHGYTRDRGGFL